MSKQSVCFAISLSSCDSLTHTHYIYTFPLSFSSLSLYLPLFPVNFLHGSVISLFLSCCHELGGRSPLVSAISPNLTVTFTLHHHRSLTLLASVFTRAELWVCPCNPDSLQPNWNAADVTETISADDAFHFTPLLLSHLHPCLSLSFSCTRMKEALYKLQGRGDKLFQLLFLNTITCECVRRAVFKLLPDGRVWDKQCVDKDAWFLKRAQLSHESCVSHTGTCMNTHSHLDPHRSVCSPRIASEHFCEG